MSPEQVRTGDADARSDIYSLGLTFYEMVTGRRPIQGDTEHALMNAQLNVIPPDPCMLNPMVPHAVSAAIMRSTGEKIWVCASKPRSHSRQTLRDLAQPAAAAAVSANAATVIAPELADLEARLARFIGPIARRLVADAALRYGSVSEIRQVLAEQIKDPKERAAFIKTDPGLTVTMAAPTPAPVVSFDAATLDRLSQALSSYLGPIAKIVVARAARAAASTGELQNALAAEIPSMDDRQRFLAALR